MFCPETIVLNTNWLMVTRYERTDYVATRAPLGERLNLLRYAITFRPGRPGNCTLNRHGWLARKWSDINWIIWKRHVADETRPVPATTAWGLALHLQELADRCKTIGRADRILAWMIHAAAEKPDTDLPAA